MNCHFTTKKKYPKHFEEPEMGCAATVGVKVDRNRVDGKRKSN